jgi:hypothetical protein
MLEAEGDISAVRFAEEMHIARLAAAKGIAPTSEQVEAMVNKTVDELVTLFHKGDRQKWEQATVQTRGSLEAWFRDARHQAHLYRTLAGLYKLERVITDDLVRQAWRARYGADGRSLHMRMIRIDTVPPVLEEGVSIEEAQRLSAAAIEEARGLAAEVASRAKEGEDFAVLAKRYSMDAETSGGGGELPLGFDHNTLPPEAVALLDTMKPGEVGGPIEAGLSHLIFELLAVREVPFDDVAVELRNELDNSEPTNVETRGYYNVLTRDLKIEVLPALSR